MLNTERFLERLEFLMENNRLNATAFAEKIGVQRSSVSHILSKRNKPSLEFMLKIHEHFKEVNLEWLILGNQNILIPTPPKDANETLELNLIQEDQKKETIQNMQPFDGVQKNEEVSQIIQLYKDGSFRTYFPKS
ncbi:MAG: helix-turn-helix transcriptional regulator [Flavobacteriaceae bacterium]|nr:helix-turn-helix transcriptional regulator [Flavobacteriaceae bacterium]MDG2503714.1 helix-turn-helix transcriptional regulator [Flavobacteriaceae bacterium]|tara:strand:+ start:798 stop:1202 length:405 start_codon:yes stop_codon:yes gene_type:complete